LISGGCRAGYSHSEDKGTNQEGFIWAVRGAEDKIEKTEQSTIQPRVWSETDPENYNPIPPKGEYLVENPGGFEKIIGAMPDVPEFDNWAQRGEVRRTIYAIYPSTVLRIAEKRLRAQGSVKTADEIAEVLKEREAKKREEAEG
jgi:hypothetical protein